MGFGICGVGLGAWGLGFAPAATPCDTTDRDNLANMQNPLVGQGVVLKPSSLVLNFPRAGRRNEMNGSEPKNMELVVFGGLKGRHRGPLTKPEQV